MDHRYRWAEFSSFDLSHVASVNVGGIRERFLGKTSLDVECSYRLFP